MKNLTMMVEFFCTQEAKLCNDGSYVSRNSGNNCQFDPCPDIEHPIDLPNPDDQNPGKGLQVSPERFYPFRVAVAYYQGQNQRPIKQKNVPQQNN